MNDDWKPGDLALCVQDGDLLVNGWLLSGEGLVRGRMYKVAVVSFDYDTAIPVLLLIDDTWHGDSGRYARRFIKVTPDEETRAEERQVTEDA